MPLHTPDQFEHSYQIIVSLVNLNVVNPVIAVSGVNHNSQLLLLIVAATETIKLGSYITAYSTEYAVDVLCITETFCDWILLSFSICNVYSAVLKVDGENVSTVWADPTTAVKVPTPVLTP